MYTIALSGPEKTRAKAELLLEEARVPIYPEGHHAPMDWASKFPEDKDAWITVEHDDIDHVARVVEKAKGWRLRVHYEVPDEPESSPEQKLAATVAEMQAEIQALKARLPA